MSIIIAVRPIDITDLHVTLGENDVLRGVTMHVDAGETVALLGGNGAGKTTLIRAILGLIPPRSGQIDLFGTPRRRFRDWHLIGYVPQRGLLQLENATVKEVVQSGRLSHRTPFMPMTRHDRTVIQRAIETVRLTNRASSQLRVLSGGQQRRALIARGLASEPKLVILDEPLAGLDLTTQEEIARLFKKFKAQGIAILVILHELGPLADLLDRSVVLRAGQVIYDGPLQDASLTQDDHHAHQTLTHHGFPGELYPDRK